MKFYNDIQNALVSVSEVKDNEINAEFCFDHSADIFKGHFPGMPILPGVMQLEITKYAVEQSVKKKFRISSVRKTKFSKEISPGDKISIRIVLTESDDTLGIKSVLKSNNEPAGKANFVFTEI